jgi:hypothetical protein
MDTNKATFSIPSILAIIAAILSFKLGAILGLIMAAVAFIFGAIGLVLALSPKTRGGALSIVAVVLSFIGVIAAIIKAISWLVNLG